MGGDIKYSGGKSAMKPVGVTKGKPAAAQQEKEDDVIASRSRGQSTIFDRLCFSFKSESNEDFGDDWRESGWKNKRKRKMTAGKNDGQHGKEKVRNVSIMGNLGNILGKSWTSPLAVSFSYCSLSGNRKTKVATGLGGICHQCKASITGLKLINCLKCKMSGYCVDCIGECCC